MADKVIHLHDIPRESKVRVTLQNRETKEEYEDEITFHRLDGMYSYCTTSKGDVVHLSVVTPLLLGDDGVYTIAPQGSQTDE